MTSSEIDPAVQPWVSALGIVDRATGIEKARQSRQPLVEVAAAAIGAYKRLGGMTARNLVMLGLATRALGLHDASVDALEADNPYAAFTLIRAYAENAAAVEYAIEKPKAINKLLGIHGATLPVARIVSHAMQSPSTRFGEFKTVYRQLSGDAHPTAKSILTSLSNLDRQGFSLTLTPQFSSDRQFFTAAGWIVEFAEASTKMLAELVTRHGEDEEIMMQFDSPAEPPLTREQWESL